MCGSFQLFLEGNPFLSNDDNIQDPGTERSLYCFGLPCLGCARLCVACEVALCSGSDLFLCAHGLKLLSLSSAPSQTHPQCTGCLRKCCSPPITPDLGEGGHRETALGLHLALFRLALFQEPIRSMMHVVLRAVAGSGHIYCLLGHVIDQ